MKILHTRVKQQLEKCFQAIEKKYSIMGTSRTKSLTFSPYTGSPNSHAFITEYYDPGYRFLFDIDKEERIYFYLRSENIGNYYHRPEYRFWSYIPLFTLNSDELLPEYFEEEMEPVFEYMKKKSGKTLLKINQTDKDFYEKILKENTVETITALDNNFLGKQDAALDLFGRNPFSLRINDGTWFRRYYPQATFLFGRRKGKEKGTFNIYLFVNKSFLPQFVPISGHTDMLRDIYLWTRIFITTVRKGEENMAFAEMADNAKLALGVIDCKNQIEEYTVLEKANKDYLFLEKANDEHLSPRRLSMENPTDEDTFVKNLPNN